MSHADSPVRTSERVEQALRDGRPVVALESTIIAHGLPRPRNHRVARELEKLVRQEGAVPATVAVLGGVPHVGLSDDQLAQVASRDDVVKASVRDLPVVTARGRTAATTVAATAWLAHRAGIRVFATGGIGGVHREAATTFDESADLLVLSRTPIVVVSSGVKSILDVPATLERLETLGVTVVGYRTHQFPGFYLTDSGERVDWRVDDAYEVAAIHARGRALGLPGGVLVGNPVDPERQLDRELHDRVLDEARDAASERGLRGKDLTPFLLDRMVAGTQGQSLEANIHAVRGNVRLAAELARACATVA